MNEAENRTPLADRLMMGPDGAVYDLRTATLQESPNDLSSAVSPRLPQRSSDGGVGGGCFGYSAEAPRRDGGTIGGCFKFSADVPRQAPGQGSPCFRFSAEAPRRDPGVIDPRFAYGAVPSRDGGVVHPCFAY